MAARHKEADPQFTRFDMLDEERLSSFVRVMTQLQAEGIQVESSKRTFQSMVKDIASQPEGTAGVGQDKDHSKAIESKKAQIEGTLKYLMANKEALDNEQQRFVRVFGESPEADPVHQLQRMSLAELTRSYDFLLGILKQRETLIKQRIADSLKTFGKEERILFESGDYRREQESVPDVLRNIFAYDEAALDKILGVNEQIQGVEMLRSLPPEEKLYQWFTDSANFMEKRNFGATQMAHANTEDFDKHREQILPDGRYSKSDARKLGRSPNPFHTEYQALIDEHVKKAQEDLDTPFDEVYHKERKLVQDIIRAEKALKSIQAKLPNPAGNRLVDPKTIEADPKYGDLFADMQSQFLRDQRAQERLGSQVDGSAEPHHSYTELASSTVEDLVSSG